MIAQIIKINRGDSLEFKLPIYAEDLSLRELANNEYVYFALVYPHQAFKDALILKAYAKQDQLSKYIPIALSPAETQELSPGVYYYTVKLKQGGTIDDISSAEKVETLIERTKFIINE